MTDELVTWLRAQLDEDYAAAPSVHDQDSCDNALARGEDGCTCRWPDRIRRDVEAKRRILDAHPFEQGIVGGVCGTCHGPGRIEVLWDGEEEATEWVDTELVWPCPTVRLLALPYADRPGYREEWRLDAPGQPGS